MTMSGNKILMHRSLPLEGRFKKIYQEIQGRIIDISRGISSGLKPGLWAVRLTDTLEKCGVRDGQAFQRSGKKMRMSEFGPSLFNMLLEVQMDRPDIIHSDKDVREEFGLERSDQRGATTRAQNFPKCENNALLF